MLCLLLAIAGHANAQFTTVLNIPDPDANIGNNGSIDSDTQLNLSDGGEIGYGFDVGNSNGSSTNIEVNISGGNIGSSFKAYDGSEVNISGGTVKHHFQANSGSEVNITGGTVGDFFDANSGSMVNISGGTVSHGFDANDGSVVNISGGNVGGDFDASSGSSVKLLGGDFHLDGVLVSGLESTGNQLAYSLASGVILSGVYTDGTPFLFTTNKGDSFALGSLALEVTDLPTFAPEVLTISTDVQHPSARRNQTVVVQAGGTLSDNFLASNGSVVNIQAGIAGGGFVAIDSVVNISGGFARNFFKAYSGSEVNISEGAVGIEFDANTGSVVNILGGTVGAYFNANVGSEVNISGGNVRYNFDANAGSVVTISGGTVGLYFNANAGSEVNISGGAIANYFDAHTGSVVSISGGTIGNHFKASSGSSIKLLGGDFYLDGALISGLEATGNQLAHSLAFGEVLSGIYADGTPFFFTSNKGDSFALGSLALEATDLPTFASEVLTITTDVRHPFARHNQTVVVQVGGTLSDNFLASNGSIVNIQAGSAGSEFNAIADSVVNISGGTVGNAFNAYVGSEVNISGGTFGDGFTANVGSMVNISGGLVGDDFTANSGSLVKLLGGDFYLNGVLISGLESTGNQHAYSLASGAVLSGIYTDGTPFFFTTLKSDFFDSGTLTLEAAELPAFAPEVLTITTNSPLTFSRRNQTVVVQAGGTLGDNFLAGQDSIVNIQAGSVGSEFSVVGSEVDISGGTVGSVFNAYNGSEVTISGGTVSDGFRAHTGSVVSISGGTIGNHFGVRTGSVVTISGGAVGAYFDAYDSEVSISGGIVSAGFRVHEGSKINISGGTVSSFFYAYNSEVNISGGTIGSNFKAYNGSEVNISGGAVGTYFKVETGSVVNISGGTIDSAVPRSFQSRTGSTVNLIGTDFLLDGLAIDGLTAEVTVTIDAVDYSLLTGILANGAAFDFDTFFLNASFSSDSTLTVTLMPDDFLAGDYNGDGQVDAADYTVWRDNVGEESDALANNFHYGIIGQPEYDTWVENFGRVLAGTNSASVPEPSALLLMLFATAGSCVRCRR